MQIKHYVPIDIGIRLKKLVDDSKLTATEIARRVEISRSSLYSYFDSSATMDIVTLIKLCAELRTTPNYLLYGEETTR